MKTTLQALIDARALIEKPENFAISVFEDGKRFSPKCRYCALGAIYAALDEDISSSMYHPAFFALTKAAGVLEPMDVADINDGRGHAAVLAIYDKAIEAERARAEPALS